MLYLIWLKMGKFLIVGILTICIFLGLGSVTWKSAIAITTKIEPAPEEVLYRSLTKLDDHLGKVWQVVLFKQVYPGQTSKINLRLVGFPGSAELIHPQPLRITSKTGQIWNAHDIFLDEAPAPTIGQYDLTEILPQLPTEPLNLAIPLPGAKSIDISVPINVVKEWKSILSIQLSVISN
ncbi:DUF3122 domain-containing protein [Sphaerospermopsis sp. LEGE 08334]|jgi:hypothetical protein|uniref:DUF3122 domain-containing protein n=1 Tax=Sphaerospermopsis sp. LEGE 08334 TaxID=1828651 RepID=UPI00188239C1|nr:DUF3122 domain-containing protein [Sphaerospermopsis sp. LEGE 08334]MBE9056117.1 DUF3122 domain-containing protein [Sphaerospermopsis sp. LEGE 08334]